MNKGIIQREFDKYLEQIEFGEDVDIQLLKRRLVRAIRKECKWMEFANANGTRFYAITAHKLLGDYPMGDRK